MKGTTFSAILIIAAVIAGLGGRAISAQDKYTLKVPNGLSFSEPEFRSAAPALSPTN